MPGLGDNLRKAGVASAPSGALWKGPKEDGVTFSLLSRFLVCRERFRLLVVEGLRPADVFNHRIEYGSMWHVCEEALAKEGTPKAPVWENALQGYAQLLCRKYPTAQEQVDHWYRVCKTQFLVYLAYCYRYPDVKERTPLLQEQAFSVPYKLPSGRVVKLRGKWDSVDLIGKGSSAAVYLQENKTKGDIKEGLIVRQLSFDLQTMLYLMALQEEQSRLDDSTVKAKLSYREGQYRKFYPIAGVRYNVVRRPLSGGKGSIVQHKPSKSNPFGESKDDYYARLGDIIKGDPSYFFMRWQVEITPEDISKFRWDCLDPILEQLCDWWEYILANDKVTDSYSDVWSFNQHGVHWRHPFGVYSVLDEGGASDVDAYLATGSTVGLERATTLFPELE